MQLDDKTVAGLIADDTIRLKFSKLVKEVGKKR
jgi:hypothetical protein